MDRKMVRDLQAEAVKVLQAHFGDKFTIKYDGARFGTSDANIKFNFVENSALTKVAEGSPGELVGKSFMRKRSIYKVVEFNPRATKNDMTVEVQGSGTRYVMPSKDVRHYLAVSPVK